VGKQSGCTHSLIDIRKEATKTGILERTCNFRAKIAVRKARENIRVVYDSTAKAANLLMRRGE